MRTYILFMLLAGSTISCSELCDDVVLFESSLKVWEGDVGIKEKLAIFSEKQLDEVIDHLSHDYDFKAKMWNLYISHKTDPKIPTIFNIHDDVRLNKLCGIVKEMEQRFSSWEKQLERAPVCFKRDLCSAYWVLSAFAIGKPEFNVPVSLDIFRTAHLKGERRPRSECIFGELLAKLVAHNVQANELLSLDGSGDRRTLLSAYLLESTPEGNFLSAFRDICSHSTEEVIHDVLISLQESESFGKWFIQYKPQFKNHIEVKVVTLENGAKAKIFSIRKAEDRVKRGCSEEADYIKKLYQAGKNRVCLEPTLLQRLLLVVND